MCECGWCVYVLIYTYFKRYMYMYVCWWRVYVHIFIYFQIHMYMCVVLICMYIYAAGGRDMPTYIHRLMNAYIYNTGTPAMPVMTRDWAFCRWYIYTI